MPFNHIPAYANLTNDDHLHCKWQSHLFRPQTEKWPHPESRIDPVPNSKTALAVSTPSSDLQFSIIESISTRSLTIPYRWDLNIASKEGISLLTKDTDTVAGLEKDKKNCLGSKKFKILCKQALKASVNMLGEGFCHWSPSRPRKRPIWLTNTSKSHWGRSSRTQNSSKNRRDYRQSKRGSINNYFKVGSHSCISICAVDQEIPCTTCRHCIN